LRHVIGREPTAEEIAARVRIPPETIRKFLGPPPPLRRHQTNAQPPAGTHSHK
jgi:hypothetical protein